MSLEVSQLQQCESALEQVIVEINALIYCSWEKITRKTCWGNYSKLGCPVNFPVTQFWDRCVCVCTSWNQSVPAEREPVGSVDLAGSCPCPAKLGRDSPNGREFYAHSPLQKLKWEVRWRAGCARMAQHPWAMGQVFT